MFLLDFIRLLFPATCIGCGNLLVGNESQLCSNCIASLPLTNFYEIKDNPMELRFAGRIPFHAASAHLFFQHQSLTRTILHEIKYHNNIPLALAMGRQIGIALSQSHRFDEVTALVPIPLHWIKKWSRGYNQSEILCQGIAETFPRPIITHSLYRQTYTNTQTKKNRLDRLKNMENVFALKDAEPLHGQHVLLVDDMTTSGSTLESAATALLQIPGITLSLVSLGFAPSETSKIR